MTIRGALMAVGLLLAAGAARGGEGAKAPFPEEEAQRLVRQLGDPALDRQEEAFLGLLRLGKSHPQRTLEALAPETPDPVAATHAKDLWELIWQESGKMPRPVYPSGTASYLMRKYQVCEKEVVEIDLSTEEKAKRVRELLGSIEGVVGVDLCPAERRVLVRFLDAEAFAQVSDCLNVLADEGIGGELKKEMELFGGKITKEQREAFERFKEEQRAKQGGEPR